jgi:hypothetical protein
MRAPMVIAPSCRLASGQLFPEGLLQDLPEPRRHRAAEQRSQQGDIARGVDCLGIHPQLNPESCPIQSDPALIGRPRDLADQGAELAHHLVDGRLQVAPCLFQTLSVLYRQIDQWHRLTRLLGEIPTPDVWTGGAPSLRMNGILLLKMRYGGPLFKDVPNLPLDSLVAAYQKSQPPGTRRIATRNFCLAATRNQEKKKRPRRHRSGHA